jgi:hypothetical protein
MMQDALQVKPGTPIEHEGKTYYGCCDMCAEKLARTPSATRRQLIPLRMPAWTRRQPSSTRLREVLFTLKLKRAGGDSRRTLLATWRHSPAGDMNHA